MPEPLAALLRAERETSGAIPIPKSPIGRTRNETTRKLARRIWLSILMKRLKVNPKQRRRAKPLIDFDMPMRRKFRSASRRSLSEDYNRSRS
jgi:hypothetical protein